MDPSAPGQRPPLASDVVARIRRERQRPRLWQWDALHLSAVKSGIVAALRHLPPPDGSVLDVWCGAKPYDVLFEVEVIGLDIDRYFGGADVVGSTPFPFRTGAVSLALCSQALHILPEEVALSTARELRRVVTPGGHVVVTVPGVMLRVGPASIEGRHSVSELRARFADWEDVTVRVSGGVGSAFSHGVNLLVDSVRRRLRLPTAAAVPVFVAVNVLALALDLILRPLRETFPHILVLTARRPIG